MVRKVRRAPLSVRFVGWPLYGLHGRRWRGGVGGIIIYGIVPYGIVPNAMHSPVLQVLCVYLLCTFFMVNRTYWAYFRKL